MKKRTVVIVLAVVSVLLLLALSSCGKKFALATPDKLNVDEDNLLTWKAVDSARTYTVEIKTSAGEVISDKATRKTSYSLSDLDMGDYEIRIMATGGEDNEKTSDWSQPLLFHRDYESGCEYVAINGNTEYRIVGGRKATGNVLIESTYRGKPVTEIADNAFKGNRNIESIVLGDYIRSIGENAFYNCGQLTSIRIPESVSHIGASAFQACRALTDVKIPTGIDTVPEYCFAYCRSLTSIVIGDNIKSISASAFLGTALTEVTVPDTVTSIGDGAFSSIETLKTVTIGKNVTTLGNEAFLDDVQLVSVTFAEGNQLGRVGNRCFRNNPLLRNIVLPETVVDIGDYSFSGCAELAALEIPASVIHIGAGAFNGSKIYNDSESDFVYAGNWLVWLKNRNSYVKITPNQVVLADSEGNLISAKSDFRADTVGIADKCFTQSSKLETITLPDRVHTLGEQAFENCPVLEEFVAGKGLLRIYYSAFTYCSTLYKLRLNEGLESIGDYAFFDCEMLNNKNVGSDDDTIIPKSVKKIGVEAFYNTALWNEPVDHIIYAGNWVVGYETEEGKAPTFREVQLKNSVVGIADYAFKQCTSMTSIGGLSRCTNIGEGAFYGCTSLKTVTLHPRVTALPDYVFYKCTELFRVEFPLMLESVGRSAFYKCTSLREFTLQTVNEDGETEEVTPFLKSIGAYAFYGCENLRTVRLNDELTNIGSFAFARCTGLSEVRLPEKITVLRDHLFAYSALPEITIGSAVTEIESHAFYKCTGLKSVTVSDSVKTIGDYAFYKCSCLSELTLGNSLESIGEYAFYNSKSLQSLRLPVSVKQIGKYAFKSAERLKSVILPSTVSEVGINAFYGCKRATFYVEEGTDQSGWNSRWNSSNRPVVNGATLSPEKDYVVSVKTSENTVLNKKSLAEDIAPLSAPERAGYSFDGWKKEDGTVLAVTELAAEPAGAVLTAVWTPLPEEKTESDSTESK